MISATTIKDKRLCIYKRIGISKKKQGAQTQDRRRKENNRSRKLCKRYEIDETECEGNELSEKSYFKLNRVAFIL